NLQQDNYRICEGTAFKGQGVVVYCGYTKTSQIWFCPSQTNPSHMLNGSNNAWMTGPGGQPWRPGTVPAVATNTRAGYSQRGQDPKWNEISWAINTAGPTGSNTPIQWP